VIVKPDVYKRDRTAVRMEPFLAVRGRLQKDGATINVIAHEVEALRVPGAPVRRRGLSRSYAAAGSGAALPLGNVATAAGSPTDASRLGDADEASSAPCLDEMANAPAPSAAPEDVGAFHASLPDPLEHWADPEHTGPSPFHYLTALRQSPPGIKSFG
jgi:hypothetical protein